MAPGWKEIKLISGGHFIWVIYDGQRKNKAYTGGGTYKIDGNQCIENLEFMTEPDANAFIGKDQHLTIKLEGNNLVLTGTLSNGAKMNETWKRVE